MDAAAAAKRLCPTARPSQLGQSSASPRPIATIRRTSRSVRRQHLGIHRTGDGCSSCATARRCASSMRHGLFDDSQALATPLPG